MQPKLTEKDKIVLNAVSEVLREYRCYSSKSQRLLAYEFGLHKSLISRLEASSNNPLFLSVWRVAEAINIKPSEFVSLVEKKLPADFKLLD